MKKIVQPRWFRNISIAKKLYFMMGVMALLIAMELFVLVFSINTLSSVRAYVGAEGLWSKSQKDAIYNLRKYTRSGKEEDYQEFLHLLKVPLGDREGRIEMAKINPNYDIMRKGFLQGGNHPDDIDGMIKLFRRFHSISYIHKALIVWTEGDSLMAEFQKAADDLHSEIIESGVLVYATLDDNLSQIDEFNTKFTVLGNNFSDTLGKVSRWLTGLILTILLFIALTIGISGLLLTIIIVRNISKGIGEILRASEQIAKGNYTAKAVVYSKDEIGVLADSFNTMTYTLEQDINTLKAADKKLKENENLFLQIFDSNPIAMTISGIKSHKIIYANNLFYTSFGYTKEEVIDHTSDELKLVSPEETARLLPLLMNYLKDEIKGRTIAELQALPPEESERLLLKLKEVDAMQNFEILYTRKNRTTFYAIVSFGIIEIDNEKYTVTSYQDISQRKKVEAELIEAKVSKEMAGQKALYSRSLIEASRDPLFTISPEGKITDINKAAVRVTDVSREKLIGTDFKNYFTNPNNAREGYQQVFAKGFMADYPLTIMDGKLTQVLFNGSVYKDGGGHVLGAVVVARDLTEQKKIEKNLENSLKEISDYKYALDESSIVAITDQKGFIKYVNNNFCKISKYMREELIGQDHRMISSHYHSKEFIRDLWTTIVNGKIWRGDLRNKAKDGSIYWVDTTIVPFLNEQGKPYQYVAIRADITERKRVDKELMEAKVFAEQAKSKAEAATLIAENAVKAKQHFLSNMSHEIRTPMNAIIGFTKVVLKTDLTEKQKEYLSAIKISGEALVVLINDILDLAKVNAGKITFEQIPFKMGVSISAMLFLFDTKAQEKGLELVKEYDNNIPEVLIGDSARLHQIILNLLSNSLKFTPKGKITVSARLLSEDEEKVTIEFAVTDTGIGIREDKIAKVFESFQQASSNTTRLFGGTGLGLAIVKELIERQGGSISVKSKINIGSTFSFILSFQKTTSEVELETTIVELDAEIKGMKILVAEDNSLNQLLIRTILDDFGFEYDVVADGKIAIEKLKTKSYDIILMDLQMPVMNGIEATEYIRNTMNSKIPILALTADVASEDVEKCRTIGMNDFIAKPIDERLLYSKIVGLVKKQADM